MSISDISKENNLPKLTLRTVNNWMNILGFKYCERKKTYYNDKHESTENIAYRHAFIQRYFEYELRSCRWIQLSLEEYEAMCKENDSIFNGKGYKYLDANNNQCIEFHIDDNPKFDALITNSFGGNLSVRKPANQKPLIIFGQDECIYKQYTFKSKCWNGPNGETPLMPKQGIMISGFVSREYGFNWELSSEQLLKVNLMRENSHYIDERAAIIKRGKTNKRDLTSSPFTRNLHYGAMNEGYWTYKDMILQVEDCIDCLKALNGQQYEYLFMFDHSNGHDRVSPDALSPTAISKNYGGVQPFMRDSVITDSSFLGPYNHPGKLKVGDVQSMSFSHTDIGPFYLREKEREERKFDKITGTKKKQLVKTELIDKLKDVGIKNPKGKKSKLLKLCKMNNINTVHTVVETTQGWVNKQTGAFQVLYERGWINPSIPFNHYTIDGKLDSFGNQCESL